jgi:hypothetical protein
MNGGITFRQAIDNNKKKVIEYLESEGGTGYTTDIRKNYHGEREQRSVLKALNELRKEGIVRTDDKVHMWLGKLWILTTKE